MIYIDVRTEEEFMEGNVPGSLNIPLNMLESQLSELSKEEQIIVFCASGARAFVAIRIMENNGFNNVVHGGSWQDILIA